MCAACKLTHAVRLHHGGEGQGRVRVLYVVGARQPREAASLQLARNTEQGAKQEMRARAELGGAYGSKTGRVCRWLAPAHKHNSFMGNTGSTKGPFGWGWGGVGE